MEKYKLDKEGLAKMYETYYPRIYNYVYYQVLSRETADDLVSSVFLKVVDKIDTYDETKAAFSTWIYTIARRTVVDYFRENRYHADLSDYADTLALSLDFEDVYREYAKPSGKGIEKLIRQLNEKEKEVIYLRYFVGCNNKQIAERTGINQSTVGTLHERALKKMLRYAKSTGYELDDYI